MKKLKKSLKEAKKKKYKSDLDKFIHGPFQIQFKHSHFFKYDRLKRIAFTFALICLAITIILVYQRYAG
ncbi:MAG: hypothetical protein ABIH38_01395 [Patescibacteria group bacterium]